MPSPLEHPERAPEYGELTLIVRTAGSRTKVELEGQTGESRHDGSLALALELNERYPAITLDELETLGQALGRSLFPPHVEETVKAALTDEQARVRLRLKLMEPKLSGLPWELVIHDLSERGFLVLDPRFSIVRDPPQMRPRENLIASDTRMRFVFAPATDLPGRDRLQSSESAQIEKLVETEAHVSFIPIEDPATAEEVRLALREPSAVFHFSGHGEQDALVLADKTRSRSSALLPAADLAVLLRQAKVNVAVLASCDSGSPGGDNWKGIASVLIEHAVPAVIAMRQRINDRAASAFAAAFYEGLFTHGSIDAAVASGRAAINERDRTAAFSIPVLYSRSGTLTIPATPRADPRAARDPVPARPVRMARPTTPPKLRSTVSGPWSAVVHSGEIHLVEACDDIVRLRRLGGPESARRRWALPGRVEAIAVTPRGSSVVALVEGALHVADLGGRDFLFEPWTEVFPAPTEDAFLLAVRRTGRYQLNALLTTEERAVGLSLQARCDTDVRVESSGPVKAAAAVGDTLLMADNYGKLIGGGELAGLLSPHGNGGWTHLDAADVGDAAVVAGAAGNLVRAVRSGPGGASSRAFAAEHQARRVQVARSPAADAIHVLVQVGHEVLQWPWDAMERDDAGGDAA